MAATYIAVWLADLDDILSRASSSFTAPPLLSSVTQFVNPAR